MKISYRRLGAVDSKRYREIRLESLKLHPESFGSGFEEQSKLPKLMFEQALEEPTDDRFVIGAFDREVLIGIFGFIPFVPGDEPHSSRTGALIQMYVKPAYRGQKIGLNLTRVVVQEAFKLAYIDRIVLGVVQGNVRAIRVYEQAGFQPLDPAERGMEVNPDEVRMIIHRDG